MWESWARKARNCVLIMLFGLAFWTTLALVAISAYKN